MSLRLEVVNVSKRFARAPVFKPVSFTATPGEILAIIGSNGTGKSTLLKIIAGVLSPSAGSCSWFEGENKLEPEDLSRRLGFVAPYLELYNDLTAREHVHFVGALKEAAVINEEAHLLRFGLQRAIALGSRLVGQYSSGMKQRVALSMAAVGEPDILLFDEPSSNLDEEGIAILFDHIKKSSAEGKIVIIATNDLRERDLAQRTVALHPFT